MTSLPPDPFACPVCDSCDHDLREDLLELIADIGANLKAATEIVLDGMESDTDGVGNFNQALHGLVGVRNQVTALIEIVPEIAVIKAANQ